MKEPISGKTLFEEFVKKIEWNQEAVAVQNPYSPAQIFLRRTQISKNAGYNKTIVKNGLANQGLIKHGSTSRLTLLEPSRRPKNPQGPQRPKSAQQMYTLHKTIQHFSPRYSRITPWRWWILQRLHNPIEHQSRCSRRRYWSYKAKSLTSPRNSRQHKLRTPGWENQDIVQPWPSTAIRRPTIWPCQIQRQAKTEMCTPRAEKNSTLTDTDPPTATMWRKHARPLLVAYQIMGTTS